MNDIERLQLRFGPYAFPPFQYGDIVLDEIRGKVEIVELSDGKIPWPIGRRGRNSMLVVYAGLAEAIRRESLQAVCHWWGRSRAAVGRWRKALDVPRTNDGTSALRKAYGQEDWFAAAQSKAAEASRGRPVPKHVRQRLREWNQNRKRKPSSRRKQGETNRLRGHHPPLDVPLWTAEEDRLVRTLSAAEAAAATGRTLVSIYSRRYLLGITRRRRPNGSALQDPPPPPQRRRSRSQRTQR